MKTLTNKSKIFISVVLINLALLLCYSTTVNEPNNHAWIDYLNEKAIPLVYENSLSELITSVADNGLVLQGEASHGTSEYYNWRYKTSKWLIAEHGFDFIVVEDGWPSLMWANRRVST